MEEKEIRAYVERLLDTLGVGCRYLGHALAIDAVCQAVWDAQQRACVRRGLLRQIAERHQCSCPQVERNLRTVIRRAWLVNEAGLKRLAAYPLTQEPTVTEFVEILAVHVLRRRPEDWR